VNLKRKNLLSKVRIGKTISCLLFAWLLLYTPTYKSFATGPSDENCAQKLSPSANVMDYVTQMTAQQIQAYYTHRHDNKYDAFNGCVLVAKNGQPIYKGAFGFGNFTTKDSLTTQSSFQLASTSKTFTSAAILQMIERGQLSLDDSIQKFYPEFPYHGITIKMLLTHRSGLPDYIYWSPEIYGRDRAYLTNQTLVEVFIKKHPPVRSRPDRMFKYCNSNFALLGSIIEKVSGQSYQQYMHDNIFAPLEMNNTYAFSMADSMPKCTGTSCYLNKWTQWGLTFSDGVLGDKGIYSSVEDMLKWDNGLKQGKIISFKMQQEAYSPHSIDRYSFRGEPNRNYGYGWRLLMQPDRSYVVYHNGNWHGCNNVFARDLTNGYTVIVLSNKANERNYQTQTVWNILGQMKNTYNMAIGPDENTGTRNTQ